MNGFPSSSRSSKQRARGAAVVRMAITSEGYKQLIQLARMLIARQPTAAAAAALLLVFAGMLRIKEINDELLRVSQSS